MASLDIKNADKFEGNGNVDYGKSGTGGRVGDLMSKATDKRMDPDYSKSGTGASKDGLLDKANDHRLDPDCSK